jgi:alanyl-tRNA synthetase
MKSSDVRNAFVNYFKKQGHTHVPSSSLIPENDPTLLFANAGMNQFKNTFLGIEQRDYKRAVTVQKCVRAGGKHNDLENVGFTARHHTFFEMLGNFSFGDYFKKDAIKFAWEFLTKDLGIPKEKLYVTVFETDDEAAEIWHKQEGVPKERIFRFGEKDNFWRMGDTGPCGPCSEIFYDHGPKAGTITDPYEGIKAGEDRFVEIWNLVFMQYYESAPGKMEPLPKPSVDTGSGLERVVAAMQGKLNNYDTDLFTPMIEVACKKVGWNFQELLAIEDAARTDRSAKEIKGHSVAKAKEDLAALRVLADHCRSAGFLIADGALPSNEGRGYVLRRIMRRAIRYGRKLSETKSVFPDMVSAMIDNMSGFYPELKQRRDLILSTVKDEESRFLQTLDQGTQILNEELRKVKAKGLKQLPGEIVFKLYDTYGFPADLTRLMTEEQGLEADEAGFEKEMEAARTKAKASWKGKSVQADEAHLIQLSQKAFEQNKATKFTGYDLMSDSSKILMLSNGKVAVNELKAGENGFIILDKTPFYAEGGGQVGDLGFLVVDGGEAQVTNTTKNQEVFVHHIEVTKGSVKVGHSAQSHVYEAERRNTQANHSATHLMHAALRKVLGSHVGQAGSIVDPLRLRFDFTHNKPMTSEEIQKVETLVNEQISKAQPVEAKIMKHKDAIASGAIAMFGEKYGDEVRVLRMGDFSTELCGGTHVSNTSQIRLFKIVSESGVSAGVRRIEAITGDAALKYAFQNINENLKAREAAGLPNTWMQFIETENSNGVAQYIDSKKEEIKKLEKEIKQLQGSKIDVDSLLNGASKFKTKSGGDARMVFADLDVEDRDVLAQITDQLKNKIQTGVVIVVGKGQGSHPIIVSVTKDLTSHYKAGDLLKEVAAAMGGKGGGRPDFAQGAAPNRAELPAAANKVRSLLN